MLSNLTTLQVSNLLIRFIWVIYIPKQGPDFLIRSFIVGFLEMLRRWQWNFCAYSLNCIHERSTEKSATDRLENEHVGNMDQVRLLSRVYFGFLTHNYDSIGPPERFPSLIPSTMLVTIQMAVTKMIIIGYHSHFSAERNAPNDLFLFLLFSCICLISCL